MDKVAIVKRLDNGWALYTRDGKRILGKHDSAQDAYKQEYAIQKSKERQKSAAPAADPTPAQIAAGNYKKEHLTFQGLRLAIENAKGSIRKGIDRGTAWRVKMPADYGYIKSHEGKDGDDVDVYVGPTPDSFMVYVVNQKNLGTGRFDEHKCMLGFKRKRDAIATYLKGFSDGSGIRRILGVKSMTMPQFKAWLQTPGNLKKQASAKEVLKEFVAETFGKTARLKKTAGVEIRSMADVATAVKALMAKQGQADPAYQAMQHISSHPGVQSVATARTRNDLAMNQMRDLSAMRGGARPNEVARVNDYMAGKANTPYISGQELQDSIPSQPGARPGQAPQAASPKPSDYMMGGRLFGQKPNAQTVAQDPDAAAIAGRQGAVQRMYDTAPQAIKPKVQNAYVAAQSQAQTGKPVSSWESSFQKIRTQAAGLDRNQLQSYIQRYTAAAKANPNDPRASQVLNHLQTLNKTQGAYNHTPAPTPKVSTLPAPGAIPPPMVATASQPQVKTTSPSAVPAPPSATKTASVLGHLKRILA